MTTSSQWVNRQDTRRSPPGVVLQTPERPPSQWVNRQDTRRSTEIDGILIDRLTEAELDTTNYDICA